MNREVVFSCPKCGFKTTKYYWRCPKCGSPLELLYEKEWKPRGRGLLRYSSTLPFRPRKTLGEGNTPLVVRRIRGVRVFFKLEYLNPSGSFKDRGALISISYAYLKKYKRVVEDTSGNTGIAVTMYSRLYGMKPVIVMPEYAPRGKKILVKALGGKVLETPTRGDAATKVLELIDDDTFYVAHTWSPFFILGSSTIAYEAFEQGFRGGTIIAPIGSGGLFLGLYYGFRDLYEWDKLENIPLPIGVEGVSVTPVYDKLYGKYEGGGSSSLADGVMVPNPPRTNEIVDVLKKNHGRIILVDNNDILKGLKELYRLGFVVEPTSTLPYIALLKLLENNEVDRGEDVFIPLTGSGLKTLDVFEQYFG